MSSSSSTSRLVGDINKDYLLKDTAPIEENETAKIFRATDRTNSKHYMLKIFNDNYHLGDFQDEVKFVKKLKHNHLIGFIQAEERKPRYIVFDQGYLGSLAEMLAEPENYFGVQHKDFLLILGHISNESPLSLTRLTLSFFQNQAMGLSILYSIKRTGHFDLKPSNIVIKHSDNGERLFKIADYAFVKNFDDFLLKKITGENCAYIHPDLLKNSKSKRKECFTKYPYQIDLWSIGVLLYQIATGNLPFTFCKMFNLKEICDLYDKKPPKAIAWSVVGNGEFFETLPDTCKFSATAKQLLSAILSSVLQNSIDKVAKLETFFRVSLIISSNVYMNVIDAKTYTMPQITLRPESKLNDLQVGIERTTKIKGDQQLILYKNVDFAAMVLDHEQSLFKFSFQLCEDYCLLVFNLNDPIIDLEPDLSELLDFVVPEVKPGPRLLHFLLVHREQSKNTSNFCLINNTVLQAVPKLKLMAREAVEKQLIKLEYLNKGIEDVQNKLETMEYTKYQEKDRRQYSSQILEMSKTTEEAVRFLNDGLLKRIDGENTVFANSFTEETEKLDNVNERIEAQVKETEQLYKSCDDFRKLSLKNSAKNAKKINIQISNSNAKYEEFKVKAREAYRKYRIWFNDYVSITKRIAEHEEEINKLSEATVQILKRVDDQMSNTIMSIVGDLNESTNESIRLHLNESIGAEGTSKERKKHRRSSSVDSHEDYYNKQNK